MRNSRLDPLLRSWLAALAAVLLLTAAACGGDDDDSGPVASGDDAAADSSDDEDSSDDDTDGDGDDTDAPAEDGGGAAAGASVTVEGVTYEATEELVCIARGGFVGGSFTSADGTIEINIDLSPEPEDPTGVRVDDSSDPDDKIQYESGGEVVARSEFSDAAQVGDYTIEGRGATGTATFIDTTKLADGTAATVEGTFEIQCSDV